MYYVKKHHDPTVILSYSIAIQFSLVIMHGYTDLVRVLAYCPLCNSTDNKPELFLILLVCLMSPDLLHTVREWLDMN